MVRSSPAARRTPPRRPASLDPAVADQLIGAPDPAQATQIAHSTAQAVIDGGRNGDAALTQRLLHLTESEGIELLAHVWAGSPALTLPGALWRMYAIREWIRRHPRHIADAYSRGLASTEVSQVIAGLADAPTPRDVARTADLILHGMFTGELDVALDRAAALLHVIAAGVDANAVSLAATDLDAGEALAWRADALGRTARELARCAALARAGELD